MRLEYRLNDETKGYPALWNYANISNSEIIARMTCEYFIKEKILMLLLQLRLIQTEQQLFIFKKKFSQMTLQTLHTPTSVLKLEN